MDEKTQEQTSILAMLKGAMPEAMTVVRGKVVLSAPLQIQVVNDEKLLLGENLLCVPQHLSDFTAKIDIRLDGGSVDSQTKKDGAHPHGSSGQHGGHSGGDGAHAHPDSEGAHVNHLDTFDIYGATIKIYNALKVGDTVYMLSYNHGKKYYILDREA